MEDKGIIYCLRKLYKNEPKTIKIGSTKNFYNRMQFYKTSEDLFNENTHEIFIFKITESKYNCYQLDKIIRLLSIDLETPYKYFYGDGSGGIEHYYYDNIDKLKIFFDKISVKYEFEKINMKHLKTIKFQMFDMIDIHYYNYKEMKKKEQHQVRSEFIDEIKQMLKEKVINQIKPHDYQLEILQKLKEMNKKHDIYKLLWSCGLGKTMMSVFIVKECNYKKILIGVPSLYLQKQFQQEILRVYPKQENILCIGSDEGSINDKRIIQQFYYKENKLNEPKFIITTYCSCHLLQSEFYNFDIKIGDESHHLVGFETPEVKSYKIFHRIKSKKTLFMTATEKVIDYQHDKTVYSMDDKSIFGEYIDVKSVKWAIEQKKITDYNFLILSNTETEIDNIIDKLQIKVENKNLFLSAFMSLKSIEKYNNLTHILVCCNKTHNADLVQKYVNILLEMNVINIDKKQFYNQSLHIKKKCNLNIDDNDKTSEITKFKKSKYGIISSVYIFGEGFDLPKLNGVVFAENMTSDIRIVQTALRPNRLDKNDKDKIAYIIVPYLESNNIEDDRQQFNKIIMIVQKMRNVDSQIQQKIKVLKISEKQKKSTESTRKPQTECYLSDEQQELERIKLRLIHSKIFFSKNNEEQNEYNYVREINKSLKIKSIDMYNSIETQEKHKHYIFEPQKYFRNKGVWINWYDFLGYDTSKFIQTKDEWIKYCLNKNVKSLEDYNKLCEENGCLPKQPDEFYNSFTNIYNELGIVVE